MSRGDKYCFFNCSECSCRCLDYDSSIDTNTLEEKDIDLDDDNTEGFYL